MHKIALPDKVKYIIETLNVNGFEGYVVGGCVRDSIINKEPHDWDITTSALPEEMKALFDKTIDTGIQHGTVTIMLDNEPFEVTTYRIDGEYEDCRRPKEVFFTKDIVKDLERRDFTINAMAYHPGEGLVDPFEGEKDLELGIIRCVGKAEDRFKEDALRMLRAVRFSAKLGFDIEKNTWEAIKRKSDLIDKVSVERIREELNKLLLSNYPERLFYLKELGLMRFILPEFLPAFTTEQNNPYHIYNVAEHTMKTVQAVDATVLLRWTMLLHDIGKPSTRTTDDFGIDHFYNHDTKSLEIAERILKRLKFDNKTIKSVLKLIEHHDYRFKPDPNEVRKCIHLIGKELFEDLIAVQVADALGQNPDFSNERTSDLLEILELYNMILRNNDPLEIKDLAIGGNDLLELGLKGKVIGEILEALMKYVLMDPELNKKEILKGLTQTLLKREI
ncbi:CCA tRNA nucleotidyltransferase [Vallitalea okinawensis]|uniref:CCA tRNA nucleotidyltransferase n=1 Tax=Vallitalea okinawensis TaxID=2078660 RepID=UPI000CFAD9F5|nr:CCA tRNA nucleotidyltransferase [Vallitalea okinawensis]